MSLHDGDRIERRVSLDFIRYGNCWEDADILCEALRPGPGKRVLSICSAGDNALALLAEGAHVVAADLNATQLACLELRCAAFRTLDHARVLSFLGVTEDKERLRTYDQLSRLLTPASRQFWDTQPQLVSNGIIQAGKLESYFRMFRQRVLPLIHSCRTVAELLRAKSREDRLRFWNRRWNNYRWRLLFRVFFSRFAMGRLGRDPEFFRYVEGSVSDRILQRTEYAFTELPTDQNPYLAFLATGNFQNSLPRYLRPENHERIRSGLHRLSWAQGPIEEVGARLAEDGFDAMNLSDIFEYLSPATSLQLYTRLLELARPKARIAYWNTLVARSCPSELSHRVHSLEAYAGQLFGRDKAFFYNAFHVDEVR